MSRARGVEAASLATAWVLHTPRVDGAIVGPRNAAHFASALASMTIELTDEDSGLPGSLFESDA
ncbi:MAG TPA: aldo/keto reductase [Vicinamibacterales bacterium]|nr:aldo/keto reductase [Vicinamibacterales bacterium]